MTVLSYIFRLNTQPVFVASPMTFLLQLLFNYSSSCISHSLMLQKFRLYTQNEIDVKHLIKKQHGEPQKVTRMTLGF